MTLSNYLHSQPAHQFSFLIFKRCHVIHGIAGRQDNMCFARSLSTDHPRWLELQYLSMPEPVTSEDSRRQKQWLTPKRFCLGLRDLWRPSLSHLGWGPPLNKMRVLATGKMLQKGWSGEWLGYIIFYISQLGASCRVLGAAWRICSYSMGDLVPWESGVLATGSPAKSLILVITPLEKFSMLNTMPYL